MPVCRRNGLGNDKIFEILSDILSDSNEKWCSWCLKWKNIDNFNTDRSRSDGIDHICRECRKLMRESRKLK